MSRNDLKDLLERFPGTRVLALGDVMLDEFLWGDIHRISPEAPVPVVEILRRSVVPGGAANAAAGIAALGGPVALAGVIGDDPQADQLRRVLRDRGIDADGVLVAPERPTTTKTRIIAVHQQVVRADAESKAPLEPELEAQLVAWLEAQIEDSDAVVVSDYGKGVVTPRVARSVVEVATARGKPVVADPRGSDFSKYVGATVITPNIHEAARAAVVDPHDAMDLDTVVERLIPLVADTALLVTRGPDGMSLFRDGDRPVHLPAVAKEVYDVTGAGDSVVSTLALALGSGAPLEHAARLANEAAGIAVTKLGTATVEFEELHARLEELGSE